jgi:NADH:ubiquinone oxidoreductase subunit
MLNWIDKNERLPTRSDADTQGFVIGKDHRGAICYHFENIKELAQCTHWIGFKQINEHVPIPKRWRTPTIHDLAKAGKPIPCRVRDTPTSSWHDVYLCAIDVSLGKTDCREFFSDAGDWYYFCEICDD